MGGPHYWRFSFRNFDYPRMPNSDQNLGAFLLLNRGFLSSFASKNTECCIYRVSLLSAVLLGIFWEHDPREKRMIKCINIMICNSLFCFSPLKFVWNPVRIFCEKLINGNGHSYSSRNGKYFFLEKSKNICLRYRN